MNSWLKKFGSPWVQNFRQLSAHKDSVAKMYGGLVTVARDLVNFSQIYANGGKLNGEQIVPEAWVQKAGETDTTNGAWW